MLIGLGFDLCAMVVAVGCGPFVRLTGLSNDSLLLLYFQKPAGLTLIQGLYDIISNCCQVLSL